MNPYRLFILLVSSMLLFVSCDSNGSQNNQTFVDETSVGATNEIIDSFVIVPVKIESVPSSDACGNDMSYSITHETDDTVFVESSSWYYDVYKSSSRMEAPNSNIFEYEATFDIVHYPQFDFYIENNTDRSLTITSLDVVVDESKEDDFPYLVLLQDMSYSNSLVIWNEAWSNWGEMTISYSILKRGESFDGNYDYVIKQPYFNDVLYIDFYQDIIDAGLNMDLYACCSMNPFYDEYEDEYDDEYESDMNVIVEDDVKRTFGLGCFSPCIAGRNKSYEHLKKGYLLKGCTSDLVNKLSRPFEYAAGMDDTYFVFARVFGKVEFSRSSFTKEFESIICITQPYLGGASINISDKFDVELKSVGKNYTLSLPYSTTIEANHTEKIQVTIKCQKSAIHDFKVRFNNENGLKINSKRINMHFINGKHSSKQKFARDNYFNDFNDYNE